jgi:hypothetical protein
MAGTRRRVQRREDFLLDDVRAALPDGATFRTGAVAERLAASYALTDTARKLLGKFLRHHSAALGIRFVGGPCSNVTDPLERGSLWSRRGR